MKGETHFCNPLLDFFQHRVSLTLTISQDHEVSSAGEFHPRALSEPDVSLSTHPAPIQELNRHTHADRPMCPEARLAQGDPLQPLRRPALVPP